MQQMHAAGQVSALEALFALSRPQDSPRIRHRTPEQSLDRLNTQSTAHAPLLRIDQSPQKHSTTRHLAENAHTRAARNTRTSV